MKWDQYRSVMERDVIKTDDIATDDHYFMSTHMPFSSLEYYIGGQAETKHKAVPVKLMSEDQVFEELICNPDNEHRMIVVWGEPGTGKSHLVRYLYGKLMRSPAAVFNKETEQVVFLRRLNNSVRGVFAQLLEQDAVKDPDMAERVRKFVSSSVSKDEDSFKTEILYAYIAAVRNDTSGKPYRSSMCRDIASYLADSRVTEHLLRDGGAIAQCYKLITAPSNKMLQSTSIFEDKDFDVRKINRAVAKQGDPQASIVANTLQGDDEEIAKLVGYLNGLTREVVQRCADISSENAEMIFAQLRKTLKKQGKNLTIFIEDFTGFTGIDQELITALSYEHGGDYKDLCRVTSVIGITDDYYFAFKGNFWDRVTHQIVIREKAYGTAEFLAQMTGRYLNAIYTDPSVLRSWSEAGAEPKDLPISGFTPPCAWETTTIEGKKVTLYPFTQQALRSLYEQLDKKTPRMFLKHVIREQLKEYFDGKKYGDEWFFPLNPGNRQMKNETHSSNIDRIESINADDRERLKAVLALWGNGSAEAVRESDGSLWIGGVRKEFFADIGLVGFAGLGEVADKANGTSADPVAKSQQSIDSGYAAPVSDESVVKRDAPISRAAKQYERQKKDIIAWYTRNESLKFDPNYREMLRTLFCGDKNRGGVIPWQDIGVPAYVAAKRLEGLAYYTIEGQISPITVTHPIVYMERSAESRDVLMALNERTYAEGWNFEGAAYYQQRLITWVERRKNQIIEQVTGVRPGEPVLPVLEWCLAIQYLKACILGKPVDTSSSYAVIDSLLQEITTDHAVNRDTREWNDLIHYIRNHNDAFDSARIYLQRASKTTTGAVSYSASAGHKGFVRADELVTAVEKLMAANWDIEAELPVEIPPNNMLYNPAKLLKTLYTNVKKAMAAETREATRVLGKLGEYVGALTQERFMETLSSIQTLFNVFAENGIIENVELRDKYSAAPIDMARPLAQSVERLTGAAADSAVSQLITYAGNPLHVVYSFLRDVQLIAQKAEREEAKALKEIGGSNQHSDMDEWTQAALKTMEELYTQIERMEVCENVVN